MEKLAGVVKAVSRVLLAVGATPVGALIGAGVGATGGEKKA
jgi:hypothetical protein